MTTFKLTRIAPLVPTHQLEAAEQEKEQVLEVTEIPTGPGKKYLITVDVKDLPPSLASDLLQQAATRVKEFFGQDCAMIIPCGNEYPAVGIYVLEAVEPG